MYEFQIIEISLCYGILFYLKNKILYIFLYIIQKLVKSKDLLNLKFLQYLIKFRNFGKSLKSLKSFYKFI